MVYDFDANRLADRVQHFAADYNAELDRWRKQKVKPPTNPKELATYIDNFVSYERVKWSETLKRHLVEQSEALYDPRISVGRCTGHSRDVPTLLAALC